MASNSKGPKKVKPIWRAIIEISLMIFLLYSTLLMREFTRANGHAKTIALAVEDIFTYATFAIAIIVGLMGYAVVEYLRKKL
jgi:hypothetical protein